MNHADDQDHVRVCAIEDGVWETFDEGASKIAVDDGVDGWITCNAFDCAVERSAEHDAQPSPAGFVPIKGFERVDSCLRGEDDRAHDRLAVISIFT